MILFYSLLTLGYVSHLALWGLILAFGIWAYRRFQLRSLPWLGIYAVLSVVMPFAMGIIRSRLVESMGSQYGGPYAPFGWTIGHFTATWAYGEFFIGNLTKLVLGILILSDVAFLLSKIGVEVEGSFLNRLLAAREKSIPLGIAMIVLMLSSPAASLALYLHYA